MHNWLKAIAITLHRHIIYGSTSGVMAGLLVCPLGQANTLVFNPLPKDIAARVANTIIEETTFDFKPALPGASDEGYAYLDFNDSLHSAENAVYFARANVLINKERSGHTLPDDDLSTVRFGIAHSAGAVEVKLDGVVIYRKIASQSTAPKGLDYDRFIPADYVDIPPFEGREHRLSIKMAPDSAADARLWMGFFAKSGAPLNQYITLTPPLLKNAPEFMHFLIAGPIDGSKNGLDTVHPLGNERLDFSVDYQGAAQRTLRWDLPRVHLLREHVDKLHYADWRYFSGIILDAFFKVSDTFDSLDYHAYINRHMGFFLEKHTIIAQERADYGRLHSPFGHYFRYALLDDTGVAALPFAERLIRKYGSTAGTQAHDPDYKIARRAIEHITLNIPRLNDGTMARINPLPLTVWADDMYMGAGIMFRMAKAFNEPSYQKEAVKQILLIDKHLTDSKTGVYWHGWFDGKKAHSSSKWGRANGWTIMAKTDALLTLDKTDKNYAALLAAYQRHARGLLQLQSKDGRWHQVLDKPSTYLETSSSAMFVRAFAEGIRNGWLPWEEFAPATFKGWQAVTGQIRKTGHVEGIVKGTPIFFSDEQYNRHPTRFNDPRGLGAILYMTVSMEKLRKEIK